MAANRVLMLVGDDVGGDLAKVLAWPGYPKRMRRLLEIPAIRIES